MHATRIAPFLSFGLFLATNVLASTNSTCQLSSISDLQQIPGWQMLIDTVNNDLGSGYQIYVNWDMYPDAPLTECTAGYQAEFTAPQQDQCYNNQALSNLTNQSGSNTTYASETIKVLTGYSGSSTITQTETTSFGMGLEVSGEVDLLIFDIGLKISTTFDFSSSLGSESTDSYNQVTEVDYTANNIPTGHQCWISVNESSCTYLASGTFPIVLDGWVWFSFPYAINGHYDWAYNLDSFESDAERSYQVPLQAKIAANSEETNGTIFCDNGDVVRGVPLHHGGAPKKHHGKVPKKHHGKVPKKHHNNTIPVDTPVDFTHKPHKPKKPLSSLPVPKLTQAQIEHRVEKDIAKLPLKYRRHHVVLNGHNYLAF